MKIKLLCLALIVRGLFGLTSGAQGANDIKVMVDIPSYGWNGKVSEPPELQNRYPATDHFYVIIENISDKPIFLLEGNGEISGLSFEIVTADGNTVIVRRKPQMFDKYITVESAVPPGQAKVEEIYYNRDWEPFPFPQNSDVTDSKTIVSLRAVLELKPPADARQDYFKGHWTGKAVSEPIEVTLLNNAINDTRADNAASASAVKLRFVRVDSEETNSENGYGKNAVDGNPNTWWHTQWHGTSPGLPHEIILKLDPPSIIKGFAYLPRQDESDHGTIKDYEFYVSNDGTNFGEPISKGAFRPGKGEKVETFEPIKCRFIKLKAISEINGLPWTSAAEIRVIERAEDATPKDYWRGDIDRSSVWNDAAKPDAIDSFVAASLAHGDLWLNGIDGMDALAASPQQVVSETFRNAHFKSGVMTSYRIVDLRKIRFGELGSYTVALADTDLGEMIVLMTKTSKPGYWWRRVYDAYPPYNRLF